MMLRACCVLWLVGCGAVTPPLPSRGGPPWFEVSSEHFTLWTDGPAERGQQLVRNMERHRQVIMRAMNYAPGAPKTIAVALRNEREVLAYLPKSFIGVAFPSPGAALPPGILFSASGGTHERVLTHELTHVISFSMIKHQPSWLAEGIATYFEMADGHVGATTIKIGLPRKDHLEYFRTGRPLAVADLFGCKRGDCKDDAFYATSWALFSYLINEHFDGLARYLTQLNELARNDDDAAAWRAAFPTLTPAALDDQLARWVRSGQLRLPNIAVSVAPSPTTIRRMTDGEVLAARSFASLALQGKEAAIAQVAEALAVDPTNVVARLVHAVLHDEVQAEDARATAAAHVSDWRAWWLVAHAVPDGPEHREAAGKVCTLAAGELPGCATTSSP